MALTGGIVPGLYEVPGSQCFECRASAANEAQHAEEVAFARTEAAAAAEERDQAARPSVEDVLESISPIENVAERLVVGIARAAGAAGPNSIETLIYSLYPTYSLGWVYPWDADAIADWIARAAKKRRVPFNSESTIRRTTRLGLTRSVTRPAWRIAEGSTLSGCGDRPRVHDVFIFEDGSFTPCEHESRVYEGANFSVYGLRVAGELLGIASSW